MNRISMSRVATIIAVATLPALALPAGAFAQATPPAPMATAPNVAPPSSSPTPALSKTMSEKVEQHIHLLHSQLGITAAEEPQWQQFAQVMRDNAAQMEQAFAARGANVATMTAADNMLSYAQVAQVHAANMQKLASSFQSLYNSFPDPQKKVADSVFRNVSGKKASLKH